MKNAILQGVLTLAMMLPQGHSADNLKAFPPAEEGMVRYVLQLPPKDDESAFRVELIVGRTMEVDHRNRHFLAGRVGRETVKGWGFTQYKVAKIGPMAGTLMAVDPNAPKVSKFITLGGEPYLIRYNSKVPVVVYVPSGAEVKYRIWNAAPETVPVKQG